MPDLWIPKGEGHSDFVEKKSRFIGAAVYVAGADEARQRIREIRDQHPRSRHVPWAYVLGKDGNLPGMSDDGEPHGTAGRPILDHVRGESLTMVLVTVVRYFGGVKLGTGGLVSAYGRAAAEALANLSKTPLVERRKRRISFDYPSYEPIRHLIETSEGRIEDERFESEITLTLSLPSANQESFDQRLRDITRGTIRIDEDLVDG